MGFIFGEGTPWTYDEVQRKRKVAEAMAGQIGSPRNVGEGLSAIGKALAVRGIEKRADRRMGELQGEADKAWEGVFGALTGGRTGGGRTYSAPVPPVSSESIEGQSVADDTMRALGREPIGMPAEVRAGVFAGESGGDYDALYGYQNREGGRYAGVKPTDMTVGEVMAFQDPGGDYGQWVKGQVGRVATPVGAYQVVGTTLKDAVRAGVVSPDEKFSPEVQDRVGDWIYKTQGTGAWEGYRGAGGGGRASPQGQNSLQAIAAAMSNPIIRNDPGKMAILQAMMGQALTPPEQMTPYQQAQLAMREREFQMRQDGTWEPGMNVTVENTGPEPGRYIYAEDAGLPKGWRFDTKMQMAERIPGGPEAVDAEAAANKEGETERQSNLKLGSTLQNLQLNISELTDGGLPVTGPGGEARRTWLGRVITGSDAMDFQNRSDAITDAAAFAELQNMRDNSPTGGAVGQLTDPERKAIGNSVTALNTATSKEEYLRAARAYRELALNIAFGEGKWTLDEKTGAITLKLPDGGEMVIGAPTSPPPDDGVPVWNAEKGIWE